MTAVSVVVTTVRCDGDDCRVAEQDEAARTRLRARLARQGWIRRNTATGDGQVDLCPDCAPTSLPGRPGPGRPKTTTTGRPRT